MTAIIITVHRMSTLLTDRDVAERLRVTVRQVWRMANDGRLPKQIKMGGSTRWRESDIAAWIEAGCPAFRPKTA